MPTIPEKIVNYNVYVNGNKLVGVAEEVTLPNLEPMTETINGAGIAGEYESAIPGHFGSMTVEIPFRVIYDSSFSLLKPKGTTVTLRAAQQSYDVSSGSIKYRPLKITLKVQPKGMELGKLAAGKMTESKNTLEVLYIKIEENKKTLLEVDKINFIFIIDGEDYLKEVRDFI